MKFKIGQTVETLKATEAYYGGIIKKGSVGVVGAVNCVYVTKPGTFNCVDFEVDGKMKRASFNNNEIKLIN